MGSFLVIIFFLLLPSTIGAGWNNINIIVEGVCGVFGFGSLAFPDSVGTVLSYLAKTFANSGGKSSASKIKQVQKGDSGVQQVGKNTINYYNTEKGEKKPNVKTYGCPNCGFDYQVSPPDDNHPIFSLDKAEAEKFASGKVSPIPKVCKNCGNTFTLYWYKEKHGVAVVSKVPPSY